MRQRKNQFVLLVLLCGQSVFAQQTNPEPLADPTAMTDSLRNGLKDLHSPTDSESKIPRKKDNSSTNKEELGDPTRMNENFRAALERVLKTKTGNNAATNTTPLRPALPKIALVASIYSANKENNHAMLRINEQTKMVGIGDKFDIIDNNQLIDIEVIDITKNAVTLLFKPNNETLILR